MKASFVIIAIFLAISNSFAGLRASVPLSQQTATPKATESFDQISSLSAEEIGEIIVALNETSFFVSSEYDSVAGEIRTATSRCPGEYHGDVARVRNIIKAIVSGQPELIAGIDRSLVEPAIMLAERHSHILIHAQAWPSPQGISVQIDFMADDERRVENGEKVIDISSSQTVIVLPGEIKDPDQQMDRKELEALYGQAMRNCVQTTAMHSVIFFEMANRGKTPYTVTEASVLVKIDGDCYGNNFDLGVEIVSKAADAFGDGNGVATPWEIENLRENLPAIHLAGTTQNFLWVFPVNPQYPDDIDWPKARKAYQAIKNITKMSKEIIL